MSAPAPVINAAGYYAAEAKRCRGLQLIFEGRARIRSRHMTRDNAVAQIPDDEEWQTAFYAALYMGARSKHYHRKLIETRSAEVQ